MPNELQHGQVGCIDRLSHAYYLRMLKHIYLHKSAQSDSSAIDGHHVLADLLLCWDRSYW